MDFKKYFNLNYLFKAILFIALIALYVLLSNAKTITLNPFLDLNVNWYLSLVIVGGIILGSLAGFSIAVIGSILNLILFPNTFSILLLIIHSLVGLLSGRIFKKYFSLKVFFIIFFANLINYIVFYLFNYSLFVLSFNLLLGFFYEVLLTLIIVFIFYYIYKVSLNYHITKKELQSKPIELVTDKKVWIILGLVFLALTLFIIILFYFKMLFITLIVGASLIIITEIIRKDFSKKSNSIKEESNLFLKILTVVIFIFVIFVIITLFITQVQEISSLIASNTNSITNKFLNAFGEYTPNFMKNYISSNNLLDKIMSYLFSFFSSFISNFSYFLINGVLIIPLMFYMYYKKRKKIWAYILASVPKKYKEVFSRATSIVSKELFNFFNAKILQTIVVSVIVSIGFYIIGVKGWFIFGLIAGIFNIVPYLGPILGSIPGLIVAFIESPILAFWALIVVLIAQAIDNFYIEPFMLPSSVKMNALLSVLLTLALAQIYGVLGMILTIPLYILYKVILREFYLETVEFSKK